MSHSSPSQLVTERLILRPFVESDWEAFRDFQRNPRMYEWEFMKYPTEKQHRRQFDIYVRAGRINQPVIVGVCYAMVTRAEGKIVGCVSSVASWPGREHHFGFHIAEPYWSKGYGTEAGRALLDFTFSLGIPRMIARCFEGNTGSVRALTKIGFHRMPLSPWQRHVEYRFRPSGRLKRHFALTAEQWRERA